jgi:Protein of unknown function (DUF1656)
MIAEFDIYGVFVPALLVFAIVASLLSLALTRLLETVGFYRFVWHRPLFDLALGVILFGVVAAYAEPVVSFLRHHAPWMMV